MRKQAVSMYCLLDQIIRFTYLAKMPLPMGKRRLNNAQVRTTACAATRFFGGNPVVAKHFIEHRWGHNRLDNSVFIRRLHVFTDTLHALFALVGDWLKHWHTEARYVLDSFPIAMCHNTPIPRCKLLMGKAYGKLSWFYGLNV
ncbi:MAG: hypothetical protein EOO56_27620 [Hymenobacter sp.]|nr:MAG: hypothetical protein EOO56_27620 [Hymenobacter sp.]